jgi:hypothetical protein
LTPLRDFLPVPILCASKDRQLAAKKSQQGEMVNASFKFHHAARMP